MNLTEKQIIEIAENLECGMRCLYNIKTSEVKTLPNFDRWDGVDEELWEEAIKEIEENWGDYFEFEGMDSTDSFRIMEDFAETVDDIRLQNELINALNRRKPFQNFKWQIDNSEYRQQWFAFKKQRFIQWVKEQIDLQNEE